MIRHITTLGLGLVLAGTLGCSSEPPEDPAVAALAVLMERFHESEDTAEKAAMAEEFLVTYPDNAYAGEIATTIADFRGDRLGDPERAFEVLQAALDKAELPENRFQISVAMAPLARELARPLHLGAVAAELASHRELTYSDHEAIMEAAEKVQDWQLAERHAEAGLAFATEDAFRAEYPNRDFVDGELPVRVATRRASALAYQGWAAFNHGRIDDGMKLLEEASELTPRDYVEVPTTPADLLRGRALLANGDAQGAIDVLSPSAVFGDMTAAATVLEQAYAEVNGGGEGFQDFLSTTRKRLAKQVDDFSLPDYQGAEHRLSDLSGRVLLLTFWFPTCGPCLVELPRLQPLYEKYHGQGLEIVAVEAFRDRERAEKFIEKNGLTYTFVEDNDSNVVTTVFGVWGFPMSFLVDREGRVLYAHRTFEAGDEHELEREIQELL